MRADAGLPLPVAQLLQRARNAKSDQARREHALRAWEASVRLAVAASPPADRAILAGAGFAPWLRAWSASSSTELLPAELRGDTDDAPPSDTPVAELVEDLRSAWKAGTFPVAVAADVSTAAPFVLSRDDDRGSRAWFLNGLGRTAEFLDLTSGELLEGPELEAAFPGASEAVLKALRGAGASLRDRDRGGGAESTRRFGDFELIRELGRGGMGEVWLARQLSLDRLVALKRLPDHFGGDPTAVARFEREVEALSRCDHPNVVHVLSSGMAEGSRYYAMELVDGMDLAAWSRSGSALDSRAETRAAPQAAPQAAEPSPPAAHSSEKPADRRAGEDLSDRRLAALFRDAAKGLQHLHELGIVHRDVKPGNLMLTADGERIVLMDLGLAFFEDSEAALTKTGTSILGTLRYMSPERVHRRAPVDRRADVYALGVTLYELLAARPFFDADTEAELLSAVLDREPVSLRRARPDLAEDLVRIVAKATSKEPEARYATAAEMADDLQLFLDGQPIHARAPTPGYVMRLAVRRNPALVTTLVVALVVMAGVVGAAVWRIAGINADLVDALSRARQVGLLAASEGAALGGQNTEALLLASSAVRISPTPAARQALWDALARPSERWIRKQGHEEARSIVFGEDGSRIFTADARGNLGAWDLEGNPVWTPSVQGSHQALNSAECDWIVTASTWGPVVWTFDGTRRAEASAEPFPGGAVPLDRVPGTCDVLIGGLGLWRWSPRSGACLVRRDPTVIRSVSCDPKGEWYAAGNDAGLLRLFSASDQLLAKWQGHRGIVRDMAASPVEAGVFVSVGEDGIGRIWKGAEQEVATLSGHAAGIAAVSYSPDGSLLLTASHDGTARIWTAAGEPLHLLRHHGGAVRSARFAPDGLHVVTAGEDGLALIWTVEGEPIAELRGHEGDVRRAEFSPDGDWIATVAWDQSVRLWRWEGRPAAEPVGHLQGVVAEVIPHERSFRAVIEGRETPRLLVDATGRPLARLPAEDLPLLAVAPTADRLLVLGSGGVPILFDANGRELARLEGHTDRVVLATFSGDGQLIATCGKDRAVRLWDLDGQCLETWTGHGHQLSQVLIADGGRTVITGSKDATARIWTWDEDEEENEDEDEPITLWGPFGPITALDLSPDEKLILLASWNGTAFLFDRSGKLVATCRGHEGEVTSASFSPDGSRVLTTGIDGTVRIFTTFGRELVRLHAHEGPAVGASWSPDGRQVLSWGEGDEPMRLCTADGDLLFKIDQARWGLVWAGFDEDGSVLTLSRNGEVLRWLTDAEELLAFADAALARDYLDAERQRYIDLLEEEVAGSADPAQ